MPEGEGKSCKKAFKLRATRKIRDRLLRQEDADQELEELLRAAEGSEAAQTKLAEDRREQLVSATKSMRTMQQQMNILKEQLAACRQKDTDGYFDDEGDDDELKRSAPEVAALIKKTKALGRI